MTEQRRLAAILVADVVGYSKLVGIDEAGTLAKLQALRAKVIEPAIAKHAGRLFKAMGDGFLVEFASAVQAVEAARAIQQANAQGEMPLRIGIHVGDVVVQGDDLIGDGVNVAARIEAVADPGGIALSRQAHDQVRDRLDITFADKGKIELKNIARPVHVFAFAGTKAMAPAPALALPDKPSIAVLPFQNMSDDAEQEYFADGIVEDIITALSRYHSLFVIARNSSFTYKGRAVDVKQVGRELGVRYVLEGSLRKAGARIRVTAQLVEAATGNHVWAERYDRDLADIFAVQDEISQATTIAIAPAISQAEQQRAMRRQPYNLDAWAAYQRGQWHFNKTTAADIGLAQKFFQQAIDLDANLACAYGALAAAQCQRATNFGLATLEEALLSAEPLARRAIALDSADAESHANLSVVLWHGGDHAGAVTEARLALSLSPNLAHAHNILGSTMVFSGQPIDGLRALQECIRLDPVAPRAAVRSAHTAAAHYFRGAYAEAADAARAAIHSFPSYPISYRWLAAALGQLGPPDKAKEALDKAISIGPESFDFHTKSRPPWFRPQDYEHMLDGLRKAGWEGDGSASKKA